MQAVWVKAITGKEISYFRTLGECCEAFDIRYKWKLTELIETGGIAPDGKTFFDYPTETEIKMLEAEYEKLQERT